MHGYTKILQHKRVRRGVQCSLSWMATRFSSTIECQVYHVTQCRRDGHTPAWSLSYRSTMCSGNPMEPSSETSSSSPAVAHTTPPQNLVLYCHASGFTIHLLRLYMGVPHSDWHPRMDIAGLTFAINMRIRRNRRGSNRISEHAYVRTHRGEQGRKRR